MSATPTAYNYGRHRALDWLSRHDGAPRQDIRNLLTWAETQPGEIDARAAWQGAYMVSLENGVHEVSATLFDALFGTSSTTPSCARPSAARTGRASSSGAGCSSRCEVRTRGWSR